MPVFLEEVLEIVRARGLDGENRQDWVQVPSGLARQSRNRIYFRRAREGRPVSEIHLSGFCIEHPVVIPVTAEEACRRHLGRVRGIIDARINSDDSVLEAVNAALSQLQGGPSLRSIASGEPETPTAEQEEGVPGPQLPDLPPEAINDWIRARLGYGNRRARAWFLGMEEACEDVLELPSRIEGGDLEDLESALARIGRYPELLVEVPALQRTWAPLIRTWLVASSSGNTESPTREAVRKYQRHSWGRSDGETLLVELLPLPAPSLQVWPYAGLGIGTRAEYQQRWLDDRIRLLGDLWRNSEVTPRVAVAYGRSYWKHYRKVFGLGDEDGQVIWPDDPNWARGFVHSDAAAVLVRHPVAFGNTNERWEHLGRWLRGFL